jgi:hypothetical protein
VILRAGVLLAIVLLAAVAPTLDLVPRRCGAVLLAALSLWWLRLDHTMEGGVLLTLSPGHGFTVADVAAIGGLVAAAYAWLRRPA